MLAEFALGIEQGLFGIVLLHGCTFFLMGQSSSQIGTLWLNDTTALSAGKGNESGKRDRRLK
jgi:hypothetical protein